MLEVAAINALACCIGALWVNSTRIQDTPNLCLLPAFPYAQDVVPHHRPQLESGGCKQSPQKSTDESVHVSQFTPTKQWTCAFHNNGNPVAIFDISAFILLCCNRGADA